MYTPLKETVESQRYGRDADQKPYGERTDAPVDQLSEQGIDTHSDQSQVRVQIGTDYPKKKNWPGCGLPQHHGKNFSKDDISS